MQRKDETGNDSVMESYSLKYEKAYGHQYFMSLLPFERRFDTTTGNPWINNCVDFIQEYSPSIGQSLSAACLSLAVKMVETTPLYLSMYERGLATVQSIKDMEIQILTAFEWDLTTITPLDFLDYYFSLFCDGSIAQQLLPEAVKHVMEAVRDVDLMCQRPSVVALVATLMAANYTELTNKEDIDLLMRKVPLPKMLDSGDVFYCFQTMQKDNKECKAGAFTL